MVQTTDYQLKKLCNKIFSAQCAILPLNQSCNAENQIPTYSPEQGPVSSTGGEGFNPLSKTNANI